jgi:NhaA family Na+:H+ antiporter
LFYTADLSLQWLGLAGVVLVVLAGFNRAGVTSLVTYLVLGTVLWFFVLKSGVHATLAGVALALTVPLRATPALPDHPPSPLHRLEHAIHPWVAFLIVPLFGFANAGVSLSAMSAATLLHPVTLGVASGLFFGKQVGIFLSIWATVKLGLARRPDGSSWPQIHGISVLAGVGFTMSLFVGMLAFPASPELQSAVKVGVLAGSLISAIVGMLVLRLAPTKRGRRPVYPAPDP